MLFSSIMGLCAFGVNPSALLLSIGAIALTLIALIFVIPALVYFIVGWAKLILGAVMNGRKNIHGNNGWFSAKFLNTENKTQINWLKS